MQEQAAPTFGPVRQVNTAVWPKPAWSSSGLFWANIGKPRVRLTFAPLIGPIPSSCWRRIVPSPRSTGSRDWVFSSNSQLKPTLSGS